MTFYQPRAAEEYSHGRSPVVTRFQQKLAPLGAKESFAPVRLILNLINYHGLQPWL